MNKTHKSTAQLVAWFADRRVVLHAPRAGTGAGTAAAVAGSGSVTLPLDKPFGQCDPHTIGQRLAAAMQQAGIKPGRVVVGLPAAWVSTQRMSVPSQDEAAIRGAVQLRVRRDFASEGDGGHSVAVDYQSKVVEGPQGVVSDVRLAAVAKDRLQAVLDCCTAADLSVQRVVPTSQAAVQAAGYQGALILGPAGLEYAAQLSAEERGSTGLLPISIESNGQASDVVDGAIDREQTAEQLRFEQASGAVPAGGLPLVDLVPTEATGLADTLGLDQSGQALSPADWLLAGSNGQVLDFQADRLSQPIAEARPAWHRWAVMGGVLALLLIGFPVLTYWLRVSEAEAFERDTRLMAPEAQQVEKMVEQIQRVSPWFDGRLSTIACLYEITRLQPERGKIDITGLRLIAGDVDRLPQGTLTGIANSRETALRLLETMRTSPGFQDATLRDTAPVTGRDGAAGGVRMEIVFDVVLDGLGKEAS